MRCQTAITPAQFSSYISSSSFIHDNFSRFLRRWRFRAGKSKKELICAFSLFVMRFSVFAEQCLTDLNWDRQKELNNWQNFLEQRHFCRSYHADRGKRTCSPQSITGMVTGNLAERRRMSHSRNGVKKTGDGDSNSYAANCLPLYGQNSKKQPLLGTGGIEHRTSSLSNLSPLDVFVNHLFANPHVRRLVCSTLLMISCHRCSPAISKAACGVAYG